jgi:hypothetical protein
MLPNPRITVEVGAETFTVVADARDDTALAELGTKLVAQVPQLGVYQSMIMRQIRRSYRPARIDLRPEPWSCHAGSQIV